MIEICQANITTSEWHSSYSEHMPQFVKMRPTEKTTVTIYEKARDTRYSARLNLATGLIILTSSMETKPLCGIVSRQVTSKYSWVYLTKSYVP